MGGNRAYLGVAVFARPLKEGEMSAFLDELAKPWQVRSRTTDYEERRGGATTSFFPSLEISSVQRTAVGARVGRIEVLLRCLS